jgi:hypothetical protein
VVLGYIQPSLRDSLERVVLTQTLKSGSLLGLYGQTKHILRKNLVCIRHHPTPCGKMPVLRRELPSAAKAELITQ